MARLDSEALDACLDAFWDEAVRQFPEVKSGDFPFDADIAFRRAAEDALALWYEINKPKRRRK